MPRDAITPIHDLGRARSGGESHTVTIGRAEFYRSGEFCGWYRRLSADSAEPRGATPRLFLIRHGDEHRTSFGGAKSAEHTS
jgi:hypothetical protein